MRLFRRLSTASLLLTLLALICPAGTSAQKKSNVRKGAASKTESSAEMRKRQQAAQREISATRKKIAVNDKSVSQGLADLNRLDADIKVTQKKVADLTGQVGSLDRKITVLQSQIEANEKVLSRLRSHYLTAVKKMRVRKGSKSNLSFIFSSRSFSQAMRRIRYLKEFNAWRERQSEEIRRKNLELKAQNDLLAKSKRDKNAALAAQNQERARLRTQFAAQDALVARLRQQGDELRAHLARKQAEANELKSSIARLIAAEQAKEAERRRIEQERQRKAEEQRLAQQRQREAEQQRLQAERQRQQELTLEQKPKADKPKKTKAPKAETKPSRPSRPNDTATATSRRRKDRKPQENASEAREKGKEKKNDGRTYADARKRQPRRNAAQPSGGESSGSSTAKNMAPAAAGFEQHKGSLPRPATGAFRITSPFGRHSMPDLPGVTYDNPGIDAEVSAGASAVAVYPGKVSGIYRLPGYNTVVIVSHGTYYTVYGNLATTAVKSGDTVKQGQTLGKVAPSDDSGRPSIHFEVWRNRDKLNPADWIR